MNRDLIVILLGTMKLCLLIGLTLGLTKQKDNTYSPMAIPILGTFVFAWITWIVTYTAQINPFVTPEFVKA